MFVCRTAKYGKEIPKIFVARNIETVGHSIKTYEKIEKKRLEAQMGGGKMKIDNQHKKVSKFY